MIYFRYEETNQRSLRILRKEEEDIQDRVYDGEEEEGKQYSTDVIRSTYSSKAHKLGKVDQL